MNETIIKAIKQDVKLAMREIEEKHGVTFNFGNGTFDTTEWSFKAKFVMDGKQGDAFANKAMRVGIDPTLYGKEIAIQGERFTIIDINPRAPKFPIIIKGADGRRLRCQAGDKLIRGLLAAEAN